MTEFTPIASTLGGLIIGMSSVSMLALNGRIAGISGIVGGLLGSQRDEGPWRLMFFLGLLFGGLALRLFAPSVFGDGSTAAMPTLIIAGLFVGLGTRLGSGCTSGHGVCGLSRLSPRSAVATTVFMVTAALTVFATQHGFGA